MTRKTGKSRRKVPGWLIVTGAVLCVSLLVVILVADRSLHWDGVAKLVAGPNLYELNLDDITTAGTTRSNLVRALGEPTCVKRGENREFLIYRSVWQQSSGNGFLFVEYFHETDETLATITLVDGVVAGVETRSDSYDGQVAADVPFNCDMPHTRKHP